MTRAVLLFLMLLLVFPAACRDTSPEPDIAPRPVITALVEPPVEGRLRSFAGVTRGEVETPISFRVDGAIISLPVKAGNTVKKGQVIARLDTRDYELNVRRLESQLALAEIQVRQATAELGRVQALFEAHTTSRSDFDQVRTARDAAEAQRNAAREALNQARNQVQYGTLEAPRDGTIIAVPVNVYQVVAAGQPVAVLRTDQTMVLEVGVAETVVGDLKIGQAARVTLEAFPGLDIEAEVSEIGAGLSGLAALPVKLRLTNPPPAIRSGQAGEAHIFFEGLGAGPRVPLAAVTGESGARRFVWVVTETDAGQAVVQRRTVETGELAGEQLEIISGLAPKERIVVRGANRLTEGQVVRLLD